MASKRGASGSRVDDGPRSRPGEAPEPRMGVPPGQLRGSTPHQSPESRHHPRFEARNEGWESWEPAPHPRGGRFRWLSPLGKPDVCPHEILKAP